MIDEERACRPADGACEAREQCDACDRIARVTAVETGRRGKCRFIETEAHANAQNHPGDCETGGIRGDGEKRQAGGEHETGCRQYIPAAVTIDRAAGERSEQARDCLLYTSRCV